MLIGNSNFRSNFSSPNKTPNNLKFGHVTYLKGDDGYEEAQKEEEDWKKREKDREKAWQKYREEFFQMHHFFP